MLREDPEPGVEAQIDYGLLGSWPNPASGRSQRVWAFVMVLSHSRYMFVHPVLTMDQASWTASHVEAFAFFGGVPARLVPDNLRTGVERSDLYDPKINRSYAELAAHYRPLIDPARRRKPKDKPRVERPMQYIRDSFWLGREFASLEQIQAQALHWCREVAGRRKARPLDGRAPIEVFEQQEAGTLIPLPREPFAMAAWARVTVGNDIHVKVGKGFYSVPWRLLGQQVDVRATDKLVQVYHHGDLVKTHVRTDRGRVTDFEDYPPEKIAFHRRTPAWCRQTAAQIGPSTSEVITGLLEGSAHYQLRSAQAILALREAHGPVRLEAACAKAIEAGDPAYRTIRNILATGLEDADLPERPPGLPARPGPAVRQRHPPAPAPRRGRLVTHPDTVALPRAEASALAQLLRTLESVLEMTDTAVADALDEHFGYPGAVDVLFAAAGMHAAALHTLLTAVPTLATKDETR